MSRREAFPLRFLPVAGGIAIGFLIPILLNLSSILNAATNLLPIQALQVIGYALYFLVGLFVALTIRHWHTLAGWILLTMVILFSVGLAIPGNAIQDVLTFKGAIVGAIHHMPTNPVNFLVAGILLYVFAGNCLRR